MNSEITDAILEERERCLRILRAARYGEIDGDIRSLIHRIDCGAPFPDENARQQKDKNDGR
jgi:hypothetical protein